MERDRGWDTKDGGQVEASRADLDKCEGKERVPTGEMQGFSGVLRTLPE